MVSSSTVSSPISSSSISARRVEDSSVMATLRSAARRRSMAIESCGWVAWYCTLKSDRPSIPSMAVTN